MTARERLPNRRRSESVGFECNGLKYTATVSWFDDGRSGEIFLGNHKSDSQADANAKDAAIIASIALQHGVALDVLRKSLLQDSTVQPSNPLDLPLDLLVNSPANLLID